MKKWIITAIASFTLFASAWDGLPQESLVDQFDEAELSNGESYARITYADKNADIVHESATREAAVRNAVLVAGDLLETGHQSYIEIQLIDGSLMQFADQTKAEFQAINEFFERESLTVIKLHEGSIFLHVIDEYGKWDSRIFRVDTREGSAYFEAAGIYRIDVLSDQMRLKVYRGVAELSGVSGSQLIRSGEYSTIRDATNPTRPVPFNSFHGDRFERWAYDRRPITESVSSHYVDDSLAVYSRDLDDQGEWRYESELESHVWVPRVNTEWRPYWNGYWSTGSPNLTWVSYDSFGWITHHYGRWGWNIGLGWYWIPRSYYSPAWVAWSSFNDNLGWCPLGYWDRPYYYNRNRQPNVVIINHHHHTWNYVSTNVILSGRRTYTRAAIPRQVNRRITTSRLFLDRDSRHNGTSLIRAIEKPEINRRLAVERRTQKPQLMTRSSSNTVTRETIKSRDSGTRAVSRYSSETRLATRSQGGSRAIERRNDSASPAIERNPTGRGDINREGTPTRRIQPATGSDRDGKAPSGNTPQRYQRTQDSGTRSAPPQRESTQAPAPRRETPTRRPSESSAQPPARKPASTRTKDPNPVRQANPQRETPTNDTAPPPRSGRSYQSTRSGGSSATATPTYTTPPQRSTNRAPATRSNNGSSQGQSASPVRRNSSSSSQPSPTRSQPAARPTNSSPPKSGAQAPARRAPAKPARETHEKGSSKQNR